MVAMGIVAVAMLGAVSGIGIITMAICFKSALTARENKNDKK